jgi:hypothetical protein
LIEIVITSTLRIVILVAVISQSASVSLPLRIGTAQSVTAEEYANLERLLNNGKKPWLLMGAPGQIQVISLNVFLPATTRNSQLRRGPALIASLLRPPAWRLDSQDPCCKFWAQVAIDGRNFDDVQDLNDLNQPFRVIGTFSDAELLSLARILRSSEEITRKLAALTTRKVPIVAVERSPRNAPANIVGAYLRIDDSRNSTGQITLRQDGSGWQIVSVAWGAS